MRTMFFLFAVGVLLTACSHQVNPQNLSGDAELRQQIVGTWHGNHGGVIVFDADGHSSSSFTNGVKKWAYQSTWMVRDSNIFSTVTQVGVENTTNHEAVGHTTRYKVIHVDDHHLVYVIDMEFIEGGRLTNWLSR